jgi:hypothetical protein
MNEQTKPGPAPAWKLWRNPIFRRFCRTRLRPRALGVALLITLLVAGFAFAMSRTVAKSEMGRSWKQGPNRQMVMEYHEPKMVDVERVPFFFLLGIQGLIIFIIATGQVAGGMTADADEQTMDYVRLSPMTPLAKVLGYLFGLPIREWIMFAATLPFTAWSLWKGQVAAEFWVPLYAVVLTAAVLYHLTGLTAGTVLKNRRWAFLVSMGGVFILYSVVPQLGRFGLVYFEYLTIWPVIIETAHGFMPETTGAAMKTAQNLMGKARFFNLDLPEAAFTIFSQLVLCLTFVVMLWRRWYRAESHLIGKVWATGLSVWIQIVLLGCSLPLVSSGQLFISQRLGAMFRLGQRTMFNWSPSLPEAILTITIYGTVTLLVMVLLAILIAPGKETQELGARRLSKLGAHRVPRFGDERSAVWFVAIMAIVGAVGWNMFAQKVIGSHWFPGQVLPTWTPWIFGLVLLTSGLTCVLLYELKGAKGLFLATIFGGIVPILVSSVMAMADKNLSTASVWISSASPLLAPANAVTTITPDGLGHQAALRLAAPRAFAFWQGLMVLVTVWLLMAHHKARRAKGG